MKCPMCDGTGKCYEQTIRYQEIETNRTELHLAKCKKCNGSGKVEITNEEWLKQCDTEQLAEWLQEHMECASCGCNKDICYQGYDCCKLAFMEWLKQPHYGE